MLEKQLRFLLLRCFNYSNRLVTQEIKKLNLLPGQPKILECLNQYDGLTPKEIGQYCVIDKSTITSLLHKMEQQQLILKKSQARDKRSIKIYLTPKGKQKTQEIATIGQNVDNFLTANLSNEQQQELITLLQQIISTCQEDQV